MIQDLLPFSYALYKFISCTFFDHMTLMRKISVNTACFVNSLLVMLLCFMFGNVLHPPQIENSAFKCKSSVLCKLLGLILISIQLWLAMQTLHRVLNWFHRFQRHSKASISFPRLTWQYIKNGLVPSFKQMLGLWTQGKLWKSLTSNIWI